MRDLGALYACLRVVDVLEVDIMQEVIIPSLPPNPQLAQMSHGLTGLEHYI